MKRTFWKKTLATTLAGIIAGAPGMTREAAAGWPAPMPHSAGGHFAPSPAMARPMSAPLHSGGYRPPVSPIPTRPTNKPHLATLTPVAHWPATPKTSTPLKPVSLREPVVPRPAGKPGQAQHKPVKPSPASPLLPGTAGSSRNQSAGQPSASTPRRDEPNTGKHRQQPISSAPKQSQPDTTGVKPHGSSGSTTPRPNLPGSKGNRPTHSPTPAGGKGNPPPAQHTLQTSKSGHKDAGKFLAGLGIGVAVGVLAEVLTHPHPGSTQVIVIPGGGSSSPLGGSDPGYPGYLPGNGGDPSGGNDLGGGDDVGQGSFSGGEYQAGDQGSGGFGADTSSAAYGSGLSHTDDLDTNATAGAATPSVVEPDTAEMPATVDAGTTGTDDFDAESTTDAGYVQQGEDAFRDRNYALAAACWRQAVAEQPQIPAIGLLLGQALFATGDFGGAARANYEAMKQLPTKQWGLVVKNYRKLYAEGAAGDYAAQLRSLEAAVQKQPEWSAARFLLGYHYGFAGRNADATRHLDLIPERTTAYPVCRQLRDLVAR